MKALWRPFWAVYQIRAAATSVLPEPTSPWMRRFIARPEAISAAQSAMARSCAPVGLNGREAVKAEKSVGANFSPGWASPSPRTSERAHTSVNSSENTRRCLARARARSSSGKCMFS